MYKVSNTAKQLKIRQKEREIDISKSWHYIEIWIVRKYYLIWNLSHNFRCRDTLEVSPNPFIIKIKNIKPSHYRNFQAICPLNFHQMPADPLDCSKSPQHSKIIGRITRIKKAIQKKQRRRRWRREESVLSIPPPSCSLFIEYMWQ